MKKLLLCSLLAAFAVAVQAGDSCCDKSKAATCAPATKKVVKKLDPSADKGATLLVKK
jgi:hypothetical protein